MAPAAAEVIEILGMTDRVVGRGDYVVWPPAMQKLPRVGAYHAPSVETLLSLGTTLLLTTSSEAAQGAHVKLRELGIEVLAVRTNSYESMLASIVSIGREVGREDEAGRVVDGIRGEMDEIRERARDAPRRRVIFVVDRDPVYVAGPGSHVDEMIRAVGGENIAADAASDWQLVSMEIIFERAPEVIIDTSENGDGRTSRPPGGTVGPLAVSAGSGDEPGLLGGPHPPGHSRSSASPDDSAHGAAHPPGDLRRAVCRGLRDARRSRPCDPVSR